MPEMGHYNQMSGNIPDAYSRLRLILAQRNQSVFQLHRELNAAGVPVNIKSVNRLATDDALQKVDLRIAAAICQICQVTLGELISFDQPSSRLEQLSAPDQARLSELMDANNERKLTAAERREFDALAEEAHRLSMENARILQAGRRRAERRKIIPSRRRAAAT